MSQNQILNATLFASDHNDVEKRLHTVAVIFSALLALTGVVCFFLTTRLAENSSTLGMSLMVVGTGLLLTAIFRFFWKSKHLVYIPTGSTVSSRSIYFDSSFQSYLVHAVNRGELHPDPTLRSSVSGSVRLDLLMSEDGSFGAVQLFEYVSYTYKPLTSIVYLSGEQVAEAKRFIATL